MKLLSRLKVLSQTVVYKYKEALFRNGLTLAVLLSFITPAKKMTCDVLSDLFSCINSMFQVLTLSLKSSFLLEEISFII